MKPVFGPGVKLDNERSRSFRAPLTDLPTGSRLILPICPEAEEADWHILPEGETVQRFDEIAVCQTQTRVVETPATGTIGPSEILPLPGKGKYRCVWLNTGGASRQPNRTLNRSGKKKLLPAQILRAADAAGLVDEIDGRLLADKLRQFCEQGITMLVCDAVCDDPYNTDDLCALLEYTEDIGDGLALAASVCDVSDTRIVTARAAEAGFATVRRLRKRLDVPLINVAGKYPIWPNLLRQKPFAGQKVGRIGAQVCKRLSRAARLSHPPRRVIVTVSGSAVREPQNFSVTIGTPLLEVLNQCAIGSEGYRQVAVHSAISGYSVSDPALVPVMQDTRCILAMSRFPLHAGVCIGCGRCSAVCPANVFPTAAVHAIQRGEAEKARLYGADECIRCGACEVVCPANLHIRELLCDSAALRMTDSWRNRSE